MFKKTLIAAAVVATTATFGATASTVTVATETVGVEYAVGINQIVANNVKIDPARDYGSGDVITLTYTGATVATWTNAATPAAITPTVTGTGTFATNIEFLKYDGNSIQLLVTNPVSVVAGTDTVTVGGVQLIIGSAADKGLVKVSAAGVVSTVLGPQNVDASTAATYITYAGELATASTSKFNAVVDVEAQRTKFTGATTTDTLVLTNTVATVGAGRGVTTTGATYTVWGNFSFLDENGDGDLLDAKDGSATSATGNVAFAPDLQSFTVKNTSVLASGTVGISINAPGTVVIPDQSFMAQADISYTDPAGGTTDLVANTLAQSSAGSWTLNGSKSHVPFLPFSAAYSQSVTISNTSAQTGGVDLVIYTGTGTVSIQAIATVTGNGVTDISTAVRTAVASAGLSGNLAFDIIVNAPTGNITTTAVYYAKADGDRLRTK